MIILKSILLHAKYQENPSPNFTATITFKWVNAEGVDDSYTGIFIIKNNKIISRSGPTKKITFLGVSGSVGGRQTQYG